MSGAPLVGTRPRVLVVDDHPKMAATVAQFLVEECGCKAEVFESVAPAVASVRRLLPDVIITDLRMAELDGLDLIDRVHAEDPTLPVIVMTAFGAIDSAVEAIQRGAFHYLTKPFPLEELKVFVERALAQRQIAVELRDLRRASAAALPGLIGRSPVMTQLRAQIERIAGVDIVVLVLGETGTGKELVAHAVHELSPRKGRPFVAVNVTALPEQLLESELFGHVRGAFTGATRARRGLFVEADGGTLFLDEVGDMPKPLQAKLLRVLETGEVRAVGSDQARTVDVRIIAATHRDLRAEVQRGTFREDLFYRLNSLTLTVPPLRDRPTDVPILAQHFLERTRERLPTSPVSSISPSALQVLMDATWAGNVRELEKTVERLVILGAAPRIERGDVAYLTLAPPEAPLGRAQREMPSLRELERSYARWVYEHVGRHRGKAAEILGVDVSTLYRWGITEAE